MVGEREAGVSLCRLQLWAHEMEAAVLAAHIRTVTTETPKVGTPVKLAAETMAGRGRREPRSVTGAAARVLGEATYSRSSSWRT